MIIGIAGKMCSGKDYIANVIKDELNVDKTIVITSFAFELKKELTDFVNMLKKQEKSTIFSYHTICDKFNISEIDFFHIYEVLLNDPQFFNDDYSLFKRVPKYRELIQYWGTEIRRKQNKNYWIDLLSKNIKKDTITIITDVRFDNEKDFVVNSGGILIKCEVDEDIREKRIKERGNIETKQTKNHSSEKEHDWNFDYIVNTGRDKNIDETITDIHKQLLEKQ